MITINPLTIKQLPIYKDCIDTNLAQYQVKMTKLDTNFIIEFSFSSIDLYERFILFVFEDVDLIDQDLPNGKPYLNRHPGEWNFELQTKNNLDLNWVTVYKDVARVLDKNIQYQSI